MTPTKRATRLHSMLFWGLWVLLLTSSAPEKLHAAPPSACDINDALRRAYGLLKADAPPAQVLPVLEAVLTCPEAETDAELLLYRAAVLVRMGEVSRAVESARAARRAASNHDDLRARATRFLELIERRPEQGPDDKGLLHSVTFELEEGSALMANVRITGVDQSTLPDEQAWGDALPVALRFYATGLHQGMISSARQRCEDSQQWPLKVWLPTGRYRLSTGQEIWVKDDRAFPLKEVRWALSTPTAAVGVSYLMPLGRSSEACQQALTSTGVEYAHRLAQNILLSSSVTGYFPAGEGDTEGLCKKISSEVGPALGGSLGIQRALTLMKDRPLLVGLSLGGFGVQRWAASKTTSEIEPDDDNTSQAGSRDASNPMLREAAGQKVTYTTYGLGLYLQPSIKLLLPLPLKLESRGYVTLGGAVQVGGLLTSPILPENGIAGAAPMLMPVLQVGSSWTF